ncbi:hypothetical protein HAV15_008497 [Penicillium sp. str. |nr:hypothetical protein HAV15_008497 [Penicillium sp. str. \
MPVLLQTQLEHVAATIAQRLDTMKIDYAMMGDAAVCLMAPDPQRATEDVDLVIRVDHRSITADLLTNKLLTSFPSDFASVRYKLRLPGGVVRLVELEVFDHQSWPNRPHAEWIIREKIRSQYQRHGAKQAVDLQDVENLLSYAIPGKSELNFDDDQELQDALATLEAQAQTAQ